jgi:hypothetical protein
MRLDRERSTKLRRLWRYLHRTGRRHSVLRRWFVQLCVRRRIHGLRLAMFPAGRGSQPLWSLRRPLHGAAERLRQLPRRNVRVHVCRAARELLRRVRGRELRPTSLRCVRPFLRTRGSLFCGRLFGLVLCEPHGLRGRVRRSRNLHRPLRSVRSFVHGRARGKRRVRRRCLPGRVWTGSHAVRFVVRGPPDQRRSLRVV